MKTPAVPTTLREQIARIVDREAWERLDALVAEREASRHALLIAEISPIIGPSLSKADDIIALLPPGADRAFDLIESICAGLDARGDAALANDLQAGFARGTNGFDVAYLAAALLAAIATAHPKEPT